MGCWRCYFRIRTPDPFTKIKSPFTNLNYEIQKGDSIQKILKKLQVQDREINNVINQYKKYGNPSKLLTADKIDIIVRDKSIKAKIIKPPFINNTSLLKWKKKKR